MKEHYVSFEQAKRLNKLDGPYADKYYVTEDFCSGNNPEYFDTYSIGDLVNECVVYFVNENNEDDYRGIPAPRLDQAQAWLREEKGIDIDITTVLRNPAKKTKYYMSNLSYFSKDIEGRDCANYKRVDIDIHSYENALSLAIDEALKLLEKGGRQ